MSGLYGLTSQCRRTGTTNAELRRKPGLGEQARQTDPHDIILQDEWPMRKIPHTQEIWQVLYVRNVMEYSWKNRNHKRSFHDDEENRP